MRPRSTAAPVNRQPVVPHFHDRSCSRTSWLQVSHVFFFFYILVYLNLLWLKPVNQFRKSHPCRAQEDFTFGQASVFLYTTLILSNNYRLSLAAASPLSRLCQYDKGRDAVQTMTRHNPIVTAICTARFHQMFTLTQSQGTWRAIWDYHNNLPKV